jgi:hypothetical protein
MEMVLVLSDTGVGVSDEHVRDLLSLCYKSRDTEKLVA